LLLVYNGPKGMELAHNPRYSGGSKSISNVISNLSSFVYYTLFRQTDKQTDREREREREREMLLDINELMSQSLIQE